MLFKFKIHKNYANCFIISLKIMKKNNLTKYNLIIILEFKYLFNLKLNRLNFHITIYYKLNHLNNVSLGLNVFQYFYLNLVYNYVIYKTFAGIKFQFIIQINFLIANYFFVIW